jgi:hypothetical protein
VMFKTKNLQILIYIYIYNYYLKKIWIKKILL